MSPRQAAHKAMEEVSGPVVAVALVLSAVFVPCAFISGITGQFFRQFALTIAVSTVISAFNSLTLSPALAAHPAASARSAQKDVLGRTARLVAWLVLPPVQLGLPPQHRPLHAGGRPGAARQRRRAGGLRRPAGVDVVDLDPPADRLHPQSGPGPILRRHPAARRRLAGADAGRRRSRHRHRAAARTASSTLFRSPASRSRSTPTAPTSATFRHARRLRQAPRLRALQRRHRRRAAEDASPKRCPRRMSPSSGRRRCPASARRAASSSSSRTAATRATW